jgi:hypothetical protein
MDEISDQCALIQADLARHDAKRRDIHRNCGIFVSPQPARRPTRRSSRSRCGTSR